MFYYPRIYKLLVDTPARFMSQFVTFMDISDSVETGREWEDAGRAEAGLERMILLTRDACLARVIQTYGLI